MKKIIIASIIAVIFTACTPAGTMEMVSPLSDTSNVEVYRYYYDKGCWVYISRFKDQPNIQTTTWTVRHGKTSTTMGNVVIYENDSIQIIRKK